MTTAWSVDAVHPTGNAVLAVVLDIRKGYHVMADKGQLREIQDFKPFPTRVWVSEATEGVLSEPPFYPRAQPFKVDFVDAPIMSFEGRTVIYLPIRLSLNTSGGAVFVKVGVEYQACAPTYCLMPQRVVHAAELPLVPSGREDIGGQPWSCSANMQSRATAGPQRFYSVQVVSASVSHWIRNRRSPRL